MHVIIYFALFLLISSDDKFFTVNCQSTNSDGSANSCIKISDENLMHSVMDKLESIESALQSIQNIVVNSQTSARQNQQLISRLTDDFNSKLQTLHSIVKRVIKLSGKQFISGEFLT